MPAHIGVTSLDGHTAPATGAVQSRETKRHVDVEEERNDDGDHAFIAPQKFYRKEVTVQGVGDAELSLVTAGAMTKNQVKIVRARQTEYNNKLPKFERVAVGHFDLA